ncbi:hypothetical protein Ciccas_004661 [Cichlidogyrus casuarinus]|uniref:Uncharacterized protein n=1 Tax=Cichlidogyrus casuarinus TaxID=1844966 RepID=A0ABD2QAX6_9PLAT
MAGLSLEEFQRFQEELVTLRSENYELKNTINKLERKTSVSSEIHGLKNESFAKILNKLPNIGSSEKVETLTLENTELKDKLSQIESQFQLQSSTLKAECQRLQADNDNLREQLQTEQHTILSQDNQETQTVTKLSSIEIQTQLTCRDLKWLEENQKSSQLENDRVQLLAHIEDLKGENSQYSSEIDSLKHELVRLKQSNEKINKDLKRQLASLMKKSLQGHGSLNSLASVSSTSTDTNHQDKCFTESDLRNLLDRLTAIQDENCSLHRHVIKLKEQLASKSAIIQRYMLETKSNSNSSTSHSIETKQKPNSLTDFLSFGKLKGLSSSQSRNSSGTPNEIHFLKEVCEELLTKNICLEETLEIASLELQKLQKNDASASLENNE